ncbi:MAG: NUDIX domain-containing protein [Chloroflexi bacterium]|nr:MAG: NUDIX domain-containing protein [Chloroflexota bacterium]
MPDLDGRTRETALPRPAARVVLLDADDRVLLIRAEWDGRSLWFTPGGRIEPGESPEAAARRELREETGVDPAMLRWEGLAWLRDWTWRWVEGDTWYASHEHFFLARLPVRGGNLAHPERVQHTPEEILALREFRWWTLDDLRASSEPTSPACLLEVLPALIEDGCPAEPLAIGE